MAATELDTGDRKLVHGGLLIQDPVIEAPTGCTVGTVDVHLRLEDTKLSMRTGTGAIKTETTYKYKQYVLKGQWFVTATDACPPGELWITIRFPGISRVRDQFAAKQPRSDSVSQLRFAT